MSAYNTTNRHQHCCYLTVHTDMANQQHPLNTLSTEDLIQRIEELQDELRMSRAFSNISETGANDATLQWQGRNRFLAEKVLPVTLQPVPAQSLHPALSDHRIIDGDNLSVMHSLLAEFRGGRDKGIDVIYMDPASNTGGDVFAYNDDYRFSPAEVKAMRRRTGRAEKLVSLDDPSRHTKWSNHMAPRLWVARKLLKNTGVIIVSIDEHELPRLWLLMEEMFGEKNRIATLIWERSRKNDANYISEGHEYMLVWARNKADLDNKRKQMAATPEWKSDKGRWRKRKDGADAILTAYAEAKAEHGDDIPKIQKALNQFFKELPAEHPAKAIRYRKVDKHGVFNDDADLGNPKPGGYTYPVKHPDTGEFCKIPTNGWRCTEETFLEFDAADKIDYKIIQRFHTSKNICMRWIARWRQVSFKRLGSGRLRLSKRF